MNLSDNKERYLRYLYIIIGFISLLVTIFIAGAIGNNDCVVSSKEKFIWVTAILGLTIGLLNLVDAIKRKDLLSTLVAVVLFVIFIGMALFALVLTNSCDAW